MNIKIKKKITHDYPPWVKHRMTLENSLEKTKKDVNHKREGKREDSKKA